MMKSSKGKKMYKKKQTLKKRHKKTKSSYKKNIFRKSKKVNLARKTFRKGGNDNDEKEKEKEESELYIKRQEQQQRQYDEKEKEKEKSESELYIKSQEQQQIQKEDTLESKKEQIQKEDTLEYKKEQIQKEDTLESKKEQIKSCFMSKGIIDYIPKRELERVRFNLDTYIDLTYNNFLRDGIVEGGNVYNNLKKKYEEAPYVLEKIIKKQIENPLVDTSVEQREIYDKFTNSFSMWFPPEGGSNHHTLAALAIEYMEPYYKGYQGRITNYRGLIEKIRDLLGCWILTISLLVPNIDIVSGKRKNINE